jgi:hypothetical protein
MAVDIAYILSSWEAAGVFNYFLPALLIFSVVFGILEATNIVGKNKGIHVIISIAIAGMTIGFGRNYIASFFSEIFSQLGVGLVAILSLVILTGLFISKDEAKYWAYGFAAIAFIIWILITVGSLRSLGWMTLGSYNLEDYAGLIVGAVLLIGVIIAVSAASSADKEKEKTPFERMLWSGSGK